MTLSGEQAQRLRAFTRRGGGSPVWHFLRGFVKHPVMVGSVIPSSKILIEKMLEPVDWDECKLFVEYGPGVGTFTQHILDRLAPDATLLTIDTNPDFTPISAQIRDSRLRPVTGSAATCARSWPISSSRTPITCCRACPYRPCRPESGRPSPRLPPMPCAGRAFLVYQFSPKVRRFIAPHFERIDRDFEWRNVPPATLFWAWKDEE